MSDPRSVDPADVEQDEEDVARREGSSDAPETDRGSHASDPADHDALEAMPAGTAEEGDQVGEGE